jgi:vacuolar-type H+-ATPase subunit H
MANVPTSQGSQQAGDSAMPDLASNADALINEAKSATAKVVEEAAQQAAGLAHQAKAEIGEATDKVRSLAADQKDLLASQVGGVAEAMQQVASSLEQSNGPSAHYARLIADNADKLSTTIRDNDVDQLLGIAQDFGRRQPALFVGAAALLGFAASRFVLASAKRREQPDEVASYGQPASNGAEAGTSRIGEA